MSYIGGIRKHIGHELVMTVGCGVLLTNDSDQVLLQRRSDTGDWCIPGGALEPYESYEEAAIREVREEVGITVRNLKLFGIYSGDERRIHYPNDDVVYSLSVIFTTDEYDGDISDQDSEVLEHRFFGRDEIPEELFPADSRAILDWKRGINKVIVH